MEGNFATEKRRTLNTLKQCVRSIPRVKQPPEDIDDTGEHCPNGPAWVPLGLLRDTSKGTSVLESKVKALKEKRSAVHRQAEAAPQERASPKKAKARKGKPLTEPAPQDAVVEPQAQIRTYLTDVLLDSTDYPRLKQEGSQGAVPTSLLVDEFEPLEGSKAAEEPASMGWSSPEPFQRFPGSDRMDKRGSSGNAKRASQNGLCGASSLKDLSFNQKYFEDANGREEHLIHGMDFESGPFLHKEDGTTGRLWRTESWDSLCSGGSNASTLSLAERVERNRSMLQEMLSAAQFNSHSLREPHTLRRHKKDGPGLGRDGPRNEILANDVDWDSGVSLQDSEGYRAFVPNQELELSPRHEQAKQLLQRARMKARTNPLRASHNILPTAPQERRDGCGISAADTKKFALKDGDPHAGGNLSDSSSGESSSEQQRKRGPSPSRVRFEDESARDAEVRYLERLQLRQRRVLDSVLLSLGRGPLVSKPDLSDYINGELHRKESGGGGSGSSKPGWEQQGSRGRSEKRKPLVVNEEGKCSACGSYVRNLTASQNPDTGAKQTVKSMHQSCNIPREGKELVRANESKELDATQEDSRTRALGPKGTPLWILPSRQRVYTERIRETYIGEVTCIDEVDSALDSATDTSDSYRTDSEEAGASSQRSGVKSARHGGPGPDPGPFPPSEGEAKNRKANGERPRADGSCRASGGEIVPRRGEIGSSANQANDCSVKGASEIRDQVTKMAESKAEAFPRSSQPVDLYQLVKKGRMQEHPKLSKAPSKQSTPTSHPQKLPSHLVPDGVADSVNKRPVETSNRTHRPANNLSQTKQEQGPPQQLTEQMSAGHNFAYRVPAPPTTGKAHPSPMPYRRAALSGSHKLTSQDPGQVDQANELSIYSASPNSFRNVCASGQEEEESGRQSPKMLSKNQLLALSTNNCNNTYAKHEPKTLVSREEQLQERQKLKKNQGPLSSSAPGVPPVAANAITSAAISLLPTREETNLTTSAQPIHREAPAAEAPKTKTSSAAQRKPLEIYPEPKRKLFAKKSGSSSSSSASGLKKFFTTLSQSTKQKLGRFRCYSMEQICAPEPGAAAPTEEPGPGATSTPKMKKAPSLQSLQLVSPFCQPRKASSVQNLHSFLGKADRSSLYALGEPKEEEAALNRNAGTPHRRSLSVEDIGSPNLARTVGRVVEVFPDGTSQLELQRRPEGNFGFRVSSGNGRPDTGIYVQEMADASTAKLYAGLLGVGDEILEVNGAKVAGLGLAQINELLLWADTLSVRVLRQRPVQR
nr:uncharacterized protein KIAA1614 homolog [Zootoca vivipara]XP_034979647.1 uncharacterized protein KIAA1614 homolog [Zootoca vivipara]